MKTITFKTENEPFGVLTLTEDRSTSIQAAVNKCIKNVISFKEIENLIIDNNFFNAYEFDQELGAKINILKAKEIWKDKFREARKPILEKLDIEYMRAQEVGDIEKQQEIITKKQVLRDITNTSLPDSLEGIKNTWPDVLNM